MIKHELTEVRGVGSITAKKLEQAGISKVSALVSASLDELSEITGFPSSRAAAVQNAARELLETLRLTEPSPDAVSKKKSKKKKDKDKKKKGGKNKNKKKQSKKKRKKGK